MPPPDHVPDPNAHHALEDGTSGGVPEEFLHPCCQKDLQEKRVRDRVLTKVRAADRAAQALARRKEAVSLGGAAGLAEWARHRHEHVCTCVWMWVCIYMCLPSQRGGPGCSIVKVGCPSIHTLHDTTFQGSGCCELMEDYPALAFLRMDREYVYIYSVWVRRYNDALATDVSAA